MEFIVSSRSHWAQWLWIQSLNKHEDQREREREFGVFGLRRSGMEAERGGGVLEKSWTEGKWGSVLIWLSIMGKNKHRNVSNSFPVTNGNGYCLATATHGLCLSLFFFFFFRPFRQLAIWHRWNAVPIQCSGGLMGLTWWVVWGPTLTE